MGIFRKIKYSHTFIGFHTTILQLKRYANIQERPHTLAWSLLYLLPYEKYLSEWNYLMAMVFFWSFTSALGICRVKIPSVNPASIFCLSIFSGNVNERENLP
jgi:hypothetical protein